MEVAKTVLDAFFPRFCVRCGNEGALFCSLCRGQWPLTPPPSTHEHVAAFAYGNPVVRDLIKAWKYDFDQSAWLTLRETAKPILIKVQHLIGSGSAVIVPIPLSPYRHRERGFNQALAIARWLGEELKLPVLDLLDRKHRRVPQADLTHTQRLEAMNITPFQITEKRASEIFFNSVLIVDDVYTTGATITSARRVLLAHKAERVVSFTLAKS